MLRPYRFFLLSFCLALALAIVPPCPAFAGFNEGLAAYKKGEAALALKEFMPLAQAGNAGAQVMVAQILINGGKGVAKNQREGMVWVRRAAEGNNLDAQVFLAQALYGGNHGEQKDLPGAAQWFGRAADAGDQRAMLSYAQMLYYGIGVAKNSGAAVPYLEKLAAAGQMTAHSLLSTMAIQGDGMAQDYAKAVRHLGEAIKSGDAGSYFVLGQLYTKGLGVEKNETEGVRLIRLAADAGNFPAMLNLAVLYINGGDDIKADEKEAYKWITIVLNRGPQNEVFYNASGIETQLRPRLSNRQIEAAQAEASRFVARPIPPAAARP